ncbi:MAG: TIGR01620 family protein [Pseudomonadota bacterium]
MTSDPKHPRESPVILDLEATSLPDAPAPADAPPIPDASGEAAAHALHMAARPGSGLGRLFVSLAGGLVALIVTVSLYDFIEALFLRNEILGWVGLVLGGGLVLLLLALALREVAAIARLGRIETVRRHAADGDIRRLTAGMKRLYASRPELEAAGQEVAKTLRDTPDRETVMATTERAYLTPLDARAEQEVAATARNVAAATALIPLAFVDVIAVLWANLRMIRRIAVIYGGRAGWFGSWRLLRTVATHLVATGAIAATDDLLGPLVGGGVLGKLSRRFGEAAVNAALTARVGVAAIDVCRPMPHVARTAPRASGIVMDALKGWRKEAGDPA